MFDNLENKDMLDRMLYDWYSYRNKSVWKNTYELWKKWIRA